MREEIERCLRRGSEAPGIGPGRACKLATEEADEQRRAANNNIAMGGERHQSILNQAMPKKMRGNGAPGIGPGRAGKSAAGEAGSEADRQREAADVRVDEKPDRERRGRNARADK